MSLVKALSFYKKYILVLLAFVILMIMQMFMSLCDNFKNIDGYKAWIVNDINRLISVSIANKKQVTEIIYEEFIDERTSHKLLQVIDGDEAIKNEIRQEFLSEYLPLYNSVKRLGMTQFQFHLPNTESFIRLQKPTHYGDHLIAARQTINSAIKERRLVMGFEEGKLTNAYRYVYPIFYDTELVGTVELSFSYYSIVKPVLSTYEVEGLLIMNKDEVDNKTLDFSKEDYVVDDYFNLGYLDRTFDIKNINENLGISSEEYAELNSLVKNSILEGRYGEDGFASIIVDKQFIWGVPIVVKDYTGESVGALVFYKNDPMMYDSYMYQKNQRRNMYIISSIIILLLLPCVVLFSRMSSKATSDSLTHLFNRHYYHENIVSKGVQGSVMMIDIDDFKKVNDQYGHGTGDLILKEIANLLKSNIRESDTAIRWGGEEFLLILKEADVNIALKKAEYLLELIRALRVEDISVTVSIGISVLDEDYDESVRKADAALYYVKAHGKNAVFVYQNN